MKMQGGGNVAVRYKEIAVAAANQTYNQQLTQLKTTFNSLTEDEKQRCILVIDNSNGVTFTPFYSKVGVFQSSYCGPTTMYIYSLDIQAGTYYYWNGTSIANYTDTTSSNPIKLMLLCNY